jgi:hypothetical protein
VRRLSKPRKKAFAITFLILVAVVSTWVVITELQAQDPVPDDTKVAVDYPVYYPKKPPAGTKLQENSFDVKNNVVTYRIQVSDKTVNVSVQKRPENVDINGFYAHSMSERRDVTTADGDAAIGVIENRLTSSLVTKKTWILITAAEGVEGRQLEDITKSMVAARVSLSERYLR